MVTAFYDYPTGEFPVVARGMGNLTSDTAALSGKIRL